MIYLDNAATTFPKPEAVYLEMDQVNRNLAVNAGRGSYKAANEASKIISETKEKILELVHATGMADVIFTPSITHAFNQVFNGLELDQSKVVYVTPYEHNAVARVLWTLQQKYGFTLEQLPIDKNTLEIDLKKTEFLFAQNKPDLVVVNAVSNVTGYILPSAEILALAKKYDAVTVLDAAQAMGLIPMKFGEIQADIIGFAGHKTLYGPFGVGGFLLRKGFNLKLTFVGGTGSDSLNLQMPNGAPERYEASSQNIVAIAGLLASLRELNVAVHEATVRSLTEYLLNRLEDVDKVRVFRVPEKDKMIGIVSFVVEGYQSGDVGTILDDEFDIAVRTGYHCAPYIHEFLKDKEYVGTVRVGLGAFNTEKDIDELIEALEVL